MPTPNWNDDDELIRDFSMALRAPAVDERILAGARMAFAWRTVDADLALAQILYDSYLSDAVGVRGDGPQSPRTLAFQGDQFGVEIELADTGIEGQLIPPQAGTVQLMTAEGTFATAIADEVGCFSLPSPPRGAMRLNCSTDAGRFTTEWVTIT
jgi:hypothetical protein